MKIYSGNAISFNFCGIPVDSGKGTDVFCSIERFTEAYTTVVGIDGEVTRCETGDNRRRVKLTIMQSSGANDLLSAIHLLDLKSRNGAGVGPLMVRDQNGTSVCVDAEAFIEKPPDQEFGKEAKPHEWSFICPNPEIFIGGN